MKKFLILFFVLCTSTQAFAKTDIEFILDISGSMNKAVGGETQIASLRKAMASVLPTIPDGTFVAVRFYGHRVEQTDKTQSCLDTELATPFAPIQREAILAKVNDLNPKGYTPIAYSLGQAKGDFDKTREADKTIILMTDGEETCGGDPVAVINQMKAEGFNVTIHTVGFNVDDITRNQLKGIATAGGGTFYDAKGTHGLQTALQEATQASLVIDKKSTSYGQEIRGGDGYDTAVPLPFNQEFRLDHHQKTNQFDYFYVESKVGQEITLTINTGDKGISINSEGKTIEGNSLPYAAISLVGPDRNKLKDVNIIGKRNDSQTITHSVTKPGRYYILVGSTYEPMHKDFTWFKVTTVAHGDLGTENDAGDSTDSAMPIETKRYEKSYMGMADAFDVFSFSAKKGDTYVIGYVPGGTHKPWMNIRIFNSFKQTIFNKGAGMGEGLQTEPITLPADDTYYLEMQVPYTYEGTFDYRVELQKQTPVNPTAP
jgi:hypothetical protein